MVSIITNNKKYIRLQRKDFVDIVGITPINLLFRLYPIKSVIYGKI